MCVRSLADHLKRWLGSTAFVANDLVLFVQNENARLTNGRFFRRVARETHYRDAVANFPRCAVAPLSSMIPRRASP